MSRGGGVVGQREHWRRKQQREQPAYGARPSRPSLRPDKAGSQGQADCVVPAHHTLKNKVNDFPIPSRDVSNQTLPPEIIPARQSFVTDIPAGDGKIDNFFLQCGLNIELNLQSLFGLLSTALLIG